MDPINFLLNSYSLGSLLDVAIAIFGVQTLLIATGAFLGLAGYISAVPFTGVLGNTNPRVIVFDFIQELVYLGSGLLFLLLVLSTPGSLGLLLAFYVPVFVATLVNSKLPAKMQSYEYMVRIRTESLMSILTSPLRRPFAGLALLWGVLVLEWAALVEINPIMPLGVWLLLIYTYLISLLQAALSHGVIFQATKTPFARVVTLDHKEFDAFIVGRGSDHYVLKTSSGDMLIQSGRVERMIEQELPVTKRNPPNGPAKDEHTEER